MFLTFKFLKIKLKFKRFLCFYVILSFPFLANSKCLKVSSIQIIRTGESYLKRLQKDCVFTYGEYAQFFNKIPYEVSIRCKNRESEQVFLSKISKDETLVLESYSGPESYPNWTCVFNLPNLYTLEFEPFWRFSEYQSFDFEIKKNGLYSLSKRLVEVWR